MSKSLKQLDKEHPTTEDIIKGYDIIKEIAKTGNGHTYNEHYVNALRDVARLSRSFV